MITQTNTRKQGGTVYVRIPPHLVEYLDLTGDSEEIQIQDDDGHHGKFISFWRKDQVE